ncbi:MAG: bifunctional pyr operon transcriptional regulator/uracil phosphoribosyltransferase PyrR [Candidatus Marinimicrobia bacterium]|jgi:pyrimidine operon attenuation protein/uracil phosphoribosyltransferase|nr:bifunctional pyr operon transcriptional regulator/uracil phosphoribosyltransferase PyrR [Candidatus Neomarinimicrobiota bacterium]|tara:strand:+ start:1406 stop:1948 length:543 start_codon:yes stop_codon:yes gene_type:complete
MSHKILMDAGSVGRSVTRLSHEILERNDNADEIVLIGIHNRGVPLAGRIQAKIKNISGVELSLGSLDITFHRDDYRERLVIPQVEGTDIPFSLDGKTVILIDDVLYTGRTIRAALDELNSFGRASKVQLAVLVDRGHRELPIKADFVGKNIPTHEGEHVNVTFTETDDVDSVYLLRNQEA